MQTWKYQGMVTLFHLDVTGNESEVENWQIFLFNEQQNIALQN